MIDQLSKRSTTTELFSQNLHTHLALYTKECPQHLFIHSWLSFLNGSEDNWNLFYSDFYLTGSLGNGVDKLASRGLSRKGHGNTFERQQRYVSSSYVTVVLHFQMFLVGLCTPSRSVKRAICNFLLHGHTHVREGKSLSESLNLEKIELVSAVLHYFLTGSSQEDILILKG